MTIYEVVEFHCANLEKKWEFQKRLEKCFNDDSESDILQRMSLTDDKFCSECMCNCSTVTLLEGMRHMTGDLWKCQCLTHDSLKNIANIKIFISTDLVKENIHACLVYNYKSSSYSAIMLRFVWII